MNTAIFGRGSLDDVPDHLAITHIARKNKSTAGKSSGAAACRKSKDDPSKIGGHLFGITAESQTMTRREFAAYLIEWGYINTKNTSTALRMIDRAFKERVPIKAPVYRLSGRSGKVEKAV